MAVSDKSNDETLTPHVESYNRFLGWMKWGTVAAAIVAVVVILIITR